MDAKKIFQCFNQQSMEALRALNPRSRSLGPTSPIRQTRDPKRDFLSGAQGMRLAAVAQRSASLVGSATTPSWFGNGRESGSRSMNGLETLPVSATAKRKPPPPRWWTGRALRQPITAESAARTRANGLWAAKDACWWTRLVERCWRWFIPPMRRIARERSCFCPF